MLIKYSLIFSGSVNSPLLEFFRGRSNYRDQKRAFNVYRAKLNLHIILHY